MATGQLKEGKRNEKQRGQIWKQKSKYFIMKSFFLFGLNLLIFNVVVFTVDEKSGLVGLAKVTTSSSYSREQVLSEVVEQTHVL